MQKIAALAGGFIVAVLASTPAHGADKNTKACPLLTSAEVGAAVGAAVEHGQESSMVASEGPSKGQTFNMCNWDGGSNGSIAVTVGALPPGASRETLVAQMTKQPWFEQLKAQGWTQQMKNVGDAVCLVITPPAAQKDVPPQLLRAGASTSCYAGAKNAAVGVAFNGKLHVPFETVKALLDNVIGRLP